MFAPNVADASRAAMLLRLASSALIVTLALPVPVSAQTVQRVSVSSSGDAGNRPSRRPSLSADGRYVAFESAASNLVPNDRNGVWDVFVHDRLTGVTERVSQAMVFGESDHPSRAPVISDDGNKIAFVSAGRFSYVDRNDVWDVYVHDRRAGSLRLASVGRGGWEGNDHSGMIFGLFPHLDLSEDGRVVAFASEASNLVDEDTNFRIDVFVHDLDSGATTRASVSSDGVQADDMSLFPSLNDDGSIVAFASAARNLVPGDTNGWWDVFTHREGSTVRVSVSPRGAQGDGDSGFRSFDTLGTPTIDFGRELVFYSRASNFSPDDGPHGDIFGSPCLFGDCLTLHSRGHDGQPADGESFAPVSVINHVTLASQATNLVENDHNDVTDIFVREPTLELKTRTRRISSDAAAGELSAASADPAHSSNSRYVAFSSESDQLVAGDTEGHRDVFVKDLIWLEFDGRPRAGEKVRFLLTGMITEGQHWMLVMLSCRGTDGFPLPDGRIVPLTFDACTNWALGVPSVFTADFHSEREAWTRSFTFPQAPARFVISAAAVTFHPETGEFFSITGPITFAME